MALFGGRVGGFLGTIGRTAGDIAGVISELPNKIIDFGISLGNKQAEFLSDQSETLQQEQKEFQTRQAGMNFSDFVSNNPLITFGGIGLVIYLILKK